RMSAGSTAGRGISAATIAGSTAATVRIDSDSVRAGGRYLNAVAVDESDVAALATITTVPAVPERGVRVTAVAAVATDAGDFHADVVRRIDGLCVGESEGWAVVTATAAARWNEERAVTATATPI